MRRSLHEPCVVMIAGFGVSSAAILLTNVSTIECAALRMIGICSPASSLKYSAASPE
jgi:hypothetical protein